MLSRKRYTLTRLRIQLLNALETLLRLIILLVFNDASEGSKFLVISKGKHLSQFISIGLVHLAGFFEDMKVFLVRENVRGSPNSTSPLMHRIGFRVHVLLNTGHIRLMFRTIVWCVTFITHVKQARMQRLVLNTFDLLLLPKLIIVHEGF